MPRKFGKLAEGPVTYDSHLGNPDDAFVCDPTSMEGIGQVIRSFPRGRKDYRCCECSDPIPGRKRHELFSICYKGKWYRFRTCLPCACVRQDYFIELGRAWTFKNLWNDMIELMCRPGDPTWWLEP